MQFFSGSLTQINHRNISSEQLQHSFGVAEHSDCTSLPLYPSAWQTSRAFTNCSVISWKPNLFSSGGARRPSSVNMRWPRARLTDKSDSRSLRSRLASHRLVENEWSGRPVLTVWTAPNTSSAAYVIWFPFAFDACAYKPCVLANRQQRMEVRGPAVRAGRSR